MNNPYIKVPGCLICVSVCMSMYFYRRTSLFKKNQPRKKCPPKIKMKVEDAFLPSSFKMNLKSILSNPRKCAKKLNMNCIMKLKPNTNQHKLKT